MSDAFDNQILKDDKEHSISVNRKYILQRQELDKFFETLVAPHIENRSLKILDACCGMGHLMYLLNQISPNSQFLGIDLKDYLIDEAEKLCEEYPYINFRTLDAYSLSKYFGKEFNISINWKTLSWLSYYEKMLEELVKVTKEHIFISSLFYDGDIDFEISGAVVMFWKVIRVDI